MSKHHSLADILQSITGATNLYKQLGEFVCRYAEIEGTCHVMFDHFSGLRREVARTIMGNARLVDVISALTRVIDLGDMEQSSKDEFHACMNQLNLISTLRHNLTHRGATATQEEITSTNELTAKSKESIEILNFHISDLENAVQDSSRLHIRLLVLISPKAKIGFDDASLKQLYEPWLYKSVQPNKPHLPPRNTRRLNRPPRSSSQA